MSQINWYSETPIIFPFMLTFGQTTCRGNLKKKQNFMAPFYGWGSTASRVELIQGGSLLFRTEFPETGKSSR